MDLEKNELTAAWKENVKLIDTIRRLYQMQKYLYESTPLNAGTSSTSLVLIQYVIKLFMGAFYRSTADFNR